MNNVTVVANLSLTIPAGGPVQSGTLYTPTGNQLVTLLAYAGADTGNVPAITLSWTDPFLGPQSITSYVDDLALQETIKLAAGLPINYQTVVIEDAEALLEVKLLGFSE
jgi:hypothetical protein